MQKRALSPISPPDLTVELPGSKSLTNRALVCAALAEGTSRLSGWSEGEDASAMLEGLGRLGVEMEEEKGDLVVHGVGGHFAIPLHPIDCRASGTTMRFLTACGALVPGRVVLDGTPRMRERPMGEIADALEAMGVSVRTVAGCPPVTIQGGQLSGGEVTIDASRSSQFLSALLMICPYAAEPVEISAGPITSRPYVDMTIETMISFGAAVDQDGDQGFRVSNTQPYRPRRYVVEPDASGASYFFAAAAVTGGRIRVEGLTQASPQGDVRFVEVLQRMGCSVERAPHATAVKGSRYLHGIDVDMNAMPDAALTLAVVACFAHGPTTIRNVPNLRLKETDRMQALKTELEKLGARVSLTETDIQIEPPTKVEPARIATYDDHRMAMSFAVAGLRVPGIVIENPDCVGKTFPGFWDRLETLG